MSKLVVIHHSGFGHTERVAEAIGRGANKVAGTDVVVVGVASLNDGDEPDEAAWSVLDEADALVIGCPTYMGSVTAELKRFMERSSKRWFEQRWRDKLAAGYTNSASPSGDKLNTLQDIWHFCMQHSMIWIGDAQMPTGTGEDALNRLGSFSGLMTQANANEPPETAPPAADLQTAEGFGERVAAHAKRWLRGQD